MMPSSDPRDRRKDAVQLAANDFAYRLFRTQAERMHKRGDPRLLSFIEGLARFAWFSHPGRLADGALENVLLEVGRTLDAGPEPSASDRGTGSRTLHVASELFEAGGHSRVLAKWVQRDLSSSHAIVVTRQAADLPANLVTIAAERGTTITALDRREAIIDRARRLRRLRDGFDRVILHHDPDDAVPVVAFATPGGCPVAMFNHAHFWFSLGSGVADVVINTLPYFRRLTESYRFPRATDVLKGPPGLEPLRWRDVDKRRAKERLGVDPDRPVVMTIATESYFTPSGEVDFFATLAKLMAARPDLQVVMVGVRPDSPLVPADLRETDRVMLAGRVADPVPYYEAADVCLESFPMPSLGGLTEAIAYGQAFPVFAYAEAEGPLRVNQEFIAAVSPRRRTEQEYLRHVCSLLDDLDIARETAGRLRREMIEDDERFGDQFASLYERIDRFDHAPHRLPRTECSMADENRELASLTSAERVSHALSNSLPLWRAASAHVGAVRRGLENPLAAASSLAERLECLVLQVLPGEKRRSR